MLANLAIITFQAASFGVSLLFCQYELFNWIQRRFVGWNGDH